MTFLIGMALEGTSIAPTGDTFSFWLLGVTVYYCVVVLSNVEVAYQTSSHTFASVILQLGSIALFIAMYAI